MLLIAFRSSVNALVKNLLFPVLVSLFFLSGIQVQGASRGITVNLKVSEAKDAAFGETVELYSHSYALVIGNDIYTNGWPKLSNAIKDAELIAEALEAKGFEVELHRNLDSDSLGKVFKRFFILKGDNPSARLFIWYAGHGATVDGEGYLIPTDAPVPTEGAAFKFASVALRDFGTFLLQAVSKHAYAVFDSCFAGTVFSSQRALPPAAITRATTMPVRQFLTSGDADQKVSDDGSFRELFIRAINGEERSDANGDGYITASELGLFLADRVTNLTESMQTPRYGKLRDKNFDRGDFVFTLPEGVVANRLQAGDSFASAEITFWNSIKNSENTGEFDAYMKQYPKGSFATLAMVKKTTIERKLKEARARTQPREKFKVTFVDSDMQASKIANVRQTPFPTAPKVGRLDRGDKVWVVGQTETRGGTWYKIARDGAELGFVYAPLLATIARVDASLAIKPLPADDITVEADVAKAEQPVKKPASASIDDRLSFLVEGLLEDKRPPVASSYIEPEIDKKQIDNKAISKIQEIYELPPPARDAAVDYPIRDFPIQHSIQDNLDAAVSAVDEPTRDKVETGVVPVADDRLLQAMETVIAPPEDKSFPDAVQMIVATVTDDLSLEVMETVDAPPEDKPSRDTVQTAVAIAAYKPVQLALLTETPRVELKPVSEYIKRYIAAADSGNSKAQLSLAYMYETGEQVEMDKAAALGWYLQAAENGELQAMIGLGVMFEQGEGATKDLTKSAHWFRKAATLGDADSQQALGYMYEHGHGLVKDVAEAARWYEKAARQGRAAAQNNLGRLYQLGLGVGKNLDKAIFWYEQAAAQGSETARGNLEELVPQRF